MILKYTSVTGNEIKYAKVGDVGLDLVATEWVLLPDDNYIEYETGIAVEIPDGHFGLLVSRSSVSKTDLILANGMGIIDSGYRGPLKMRFKILGSKREFPVIYRIGDKIGQLIILPYSVITPQLVDKLSESERGENGFGSTGK